MVCCPTTGALRSTCNKLCCHNMLLELNLSQLPQQVAGVVRVSRISTTRRSGLCCQTLATDLQFVVGNSLPICCDCQPEATLRQGTALGRGRVVCGPDLSEHYDFCTACLDIDLLKTIDIVRAKRAEKYEKN